MQHSVIISIIIIIIIYQFNQKERAAQKALGLYEVPP